MVILLTSSSAALASEDVSSSESDFDLDLLQFLGETAGLESFGVDLDDLLDGDDSKKQQGGVNNEH
jgi:hypothetical protein